MIDTNEFEKVKKMLEKLEDNTFEVQFQEVSKENKTLKVKNKDITKKVESQKKLLKDYEMKLRELFSVFAGYEKNIYNLSLNIENLKEKNYLLESRLQDQIVKNKALKNQLSYRVGKQIISIKDRKSLLSLPKNLLDDYIEHKSNLNHTQKVELLKFVSSPLREVEIDSVIFNKSNMLSLKSKEMGLIIDNVEDLLVFELYSVKPNATIGFDISITSLKGDCKFTILQSDKNINLSEGESCKISFESQSQVMKPLIDIKKNNGYIFITFIKTRGVPSFINISSKNAKDFSIEEAKKKHIISIPELKKVNAVLFEAEEISKSIDKETAMAFVDKYMKKKYVSATNVFKANFVRNNRGQWLSYINAYLKSFDCSPISLVNNKDKLFYRIVSANKAELINNDIKISVIMPAYNAEKTIRHAMSSILNQTWQNLELIVINDCSSDNTLQVIKEVASKDERVKIINNPANVGAYVSKNLGLKIAGGDYITGHDSDDWAHPQRIEKHVQEIQKEKVKPRASITRMIRMNEDGYFPFYLEGTFCLDGVLRVASITCMFESKFLKETLGGWDCSRFGADSEIIARTKMILGDEFKDYHLMSMICLDTPGSLTNNPIHGVQKGKGLSPSRKFYRDEWVEWHKTLDISSMYLEFPHLDRKFAVPEGTEIPTDNIRKAIDNVKQVYGV